MIYIQVIYAAPGYKQNQHPQRQEAQLHCQEEGRYLQASWEWKRDECQDLGKVSFLNLHLKQAETLLNEEAQLPVYDIVAIMCDQLNGRLSTIQKFG